MSDGIFTLPKVAQLLKAAEKTVYIVAKKGKLTAFKVGGPNRFRRTSSCRWLDAKTRRADGPGAELSQ